MNSYQKNNESLSKLDIKLSTWHITHYYDKLKVLDDLSIELRKNEFVSILGPSGCGKSTLFHIIAGLLSPSEGTIEIDAETQTGKKNLVSYMHQKDLLLPWQKVIDNVALPYHVNGFSKKESRKKVEDFFKTFGLDGFEHHYPSQLSGGMKQRAALMRTYMCEKDIILLDEPFGRLDALTKLKMQQWLKTVTLQFDASVLFITHDIEEAIYLSNRIYVLSDRPAKIAKEFVIDLPKDDFLSCTTSEIFNLLKAEIFNLL